MQAHHIIRHLIIWRKFFLVNLHDFSALVGRYADDVFGSPTINDVYGSPTSTSITTSRSLALSCLMLLCFCHCCSDLLSTYL